MKCSIIVLSLANSADPDEMQHYVDFISIFTVCQSTCLGVSHIQRVSGPAQEILVLIGQQSRLRSIWASTNLTRDFNSYGLCT